MDVGSKLKLNEESFQLLLPENIKVKSPRFFTPEGIAIQSAKWLSGKDRRVVLDIGAGVGKFCLFGAYHTKSNFVGIEMRPHLVRIAKKMFRRFEVNNVRMLEGNIMDFEFFNYTAFYLYNPFHENIVPHLRMDDNLYLSHSLYGIYSDYTRTQLNKAELGSRLVTYYGNSYEVPPSYRKTEEFNGGALKYWIKEK